jgi:hypothetical protein
VLRPGNIGSSNSASSSTILGNQLHEGIFKLSRLRLQIFDIIERNVEAFEQLRNL